MSINKDENVAHSQHIDNVISFGDEVCAIKK